MRYWFLVIGLVWLGFAPVAASTVDVLELMRSVRYALERVDEKVELTLTTTTSQGTQPQKMLSVWQANRPSGDLIWVAQTAPAHLAGTQLMTLGNAQWIKFKKGPRRQVAMNDKGNSFLQSAFFYEDLEGWSLNDYTWKLSADEGNVVIVNAFPKPGKSVYGRLEMTVDRDKHAVIKTVYYDRSGALWKTESRSDFRLEKFVWRPWCIEMTDHQKGRTTKAVITKRELGPIPNHMFSPSRLDD